MAVVGINHVRDVACDLFVSHANFHAKIFGAVTTIAAFLSLRVSGKGYCAIDPLLLLKAIAFHPSKYLRLAMYLLPVGGLICFEPSFLFPPIISVLPHILSQAVMQLDLVDIYSMPSQPFLFVGAVFGSVRLLQALGYRARGHLVSALIVVAGAGLLKSHAYFKSNN